MELHKCIQAVRSCCCILSHFRNKQRIARIAVGFHNIHCIWHINIRSQRKQWRGCYLPYPVYVFHRTTGRIRPCIPWVLLQPCIGITGNRICLLPFRSNLLQCRSEIVCHKVFSGIFPECFRPRACHSILFRHFFRYLHGKFFFCRLTVIPVASKQPHLIFYLHGNYRIMSFILLPDMPHEICKSCCIFFHRSITKRGNCI